MATESIQDIKRRIRSVTSTERITNSMKLVSSGKLRKAKKLFDKTSENSKYITDTIVDLFESDQDVPEKYLAGNRKIKRSAYIIITSSKGLCGGFNMNVIKEAQKSFDEEMRLGINTPAKSGLGATSGLDSRENPVIIAVGNKGKEYFEKRGYDIFDSYLMPPEEITFLEAMEIVNPLITMYNNEEIDEINLIYTSYINTMDQEVRKERILPFEAERDRAGYGTSKKIEYEPSAEVVFNYLIPKYVETKIYSAVVESATCEHAARRTAMENATDNARDMLDNLNLTYNRARQSAITNEIIEIVAGSEAQN